LAIQGVVHGGQSPIVGAQIYLLAANTGGYGAASTSLLNNVPGSTTLDTSTGPTHGFYYVTSGPGGIFSITNDYSCTANTQVYLYAMGGNPGLTPPTTFNSAAGLLAVLGTCPGGTNAFLGTIPHVVINEVSTVAAAYAFAGFATDALHVSSPGSAQTGIQNAFANAANLASIGTGTALAIPPSDPNGTAPQATVYSIANILASCVGTDGTETGGVSPTPCYTLVTTALSGGATGTQPADTASAAINIAHNPGANVTALWGLISGTPAFGSGLTMQPNDFTLGLQFTSGGLNAPNAIAIDGSGNAWITNSGSTPNTVTKLASSGAAASGSPYDVGGMDGLVGIAIDLNTPGNAWVANDLTASTGSVIELSSSGTLVSPSPFTVGLGTPAGIAIDGSGNAWITNSNNNTVAELTSAGTAHSGSPYSVGGLSTPTSIAIDNSGNAWITNNNTVTELTPAGAAAIGSPFTGGLDSPSGIAIDHSNDAWVPNASSGSVSELKSSGTPASGSPFSGSFSNPGGVAIDGAGNVWVANLLGESVAELSNTGAILSGANGFGYTDGSVVEPDAIAIDSSGNVWIGNLGGNGAASNGSITELVGAATPVVTPLAAAVKNGALGTQP
jgi:sugar lactone lactonase YvrE